MGSLRFRRFTQPLLLMGVERGLLHEFFGKFARELAGGSVVLPDASVPDDEYFRALCRLLMAPEGLPFALNEALYAVDEMADSDGRARLQAAVEGARLPVGVRQESSDLDFAIQTWLLAPSLFTRKHAERQSSRCSTFEYFGAVKPTDRTRTFAPPDDRTLRGLTAAIDAWYVRRQKGVETTAIEVYWFEDETWFLVRHGDTYVRAPALDGAQRRVIHYRPEKDDLAVYCPTLDEIRVTVRTKGEKTLYRECFGFYLFGDLQHFSPAMTYTLEPLVAEGSRSLEVDGLRGVSRIALAGLDVSLDASGSEVILHRGADLFASAAESGRTLFPENSTVMRAAFSFFFTGCAKPRTVHVCPPNKLRIARGCDAEVVHRWLSLRRFRVTGVAA